MRKFPRPRGLVEQIGQQGRVTDAASSELDDPDPQRLLVDPKLDLAPDRSFGATMLACMPVALDLEAGAVDQQVQRPLRTAVGDY